MTDALAVPDVVDTLVAMDVVDLDSNGTWPGEPDDSNVYWD